MGVLYFPLHVYRQCSPRLPYCVIVFDHLVGHSVKSVSSIGLLVSAAVRLFYLLRSSLIYLPVLLFELREVS